ncbi:hypothetical protein, partial [Nostocoides australiense]|uniref:hypothetical protein n=1 Tax=Nostocoides australiense TaxID=99480 RepID=UPI0006604A41
MAVSTSLSVAEAVLNKTLDGVRLAAGAIGAPLGPLAAPAPRQMRPRPAAPAPVSRDGLVAGDGVASGDGLVGAGWRQP